MKIISSFTDYYDFALGGVPDQSPIYRRETNTVNRWSVRNWVRDPFFLKYPKLAAIIQSMPDFFDHKYGLIGFCGKVYPTYCGVFSLEKLFPVVAEVVKRSSKWPGSSFSKEWYERFLNARPSKIRPGRQPDLSKANLEKFWAEFDGDVGDAVFFDLKTPAFQLGFEPDYSQDSVLIYRYYQSLTLTTNPELKPLNFEKQISSYQAYQQIDGFLGNNLAMKTDPEPRGITEELKAEAHGYDKWSFRTHADDSRKGRKRKEKEEKRRQEMLERSRKKPADEWERDFIVGEP